MTTIKSIARFIGKLLRTIKALRPHFDELKAIWAAKKEAK
jgi:hypothetical protein